MDTEEVLQLLEKAQAGDRSAIGQLLERYRPYLRILAIRDLDHRLQGRLDASDIVQQTFLEAQRDLEKFRGSAEPELIAWLRMILSHNVSEAIQRHLATKKRSAKREQSLGGEGDELQKLERILATDLSTPSQKLMRSETAVELAIAIETLPADQQEAVRLRHIEGLSLAEISERMERSDTAVAGLIKRGLRGLRRRFGVID